MHVLIVLAHPERESFNCAMAHEGEKALVEAGHQVAVHDLYRMGFDPVSDRRNFTGAKDPDRFKQQAEEIHATETDGFVPEIRAEQEALEWCDLLVLQFPLWWFGMPAMLKGWVDRVFAMGRTYGLGRWYDQGVFRGKRAIVSTTTGGPDTMYAEDGLNGPMETLLFPVQHGILYFTGFSVLSPHVVWGPSHLSAEERVAELARWQRRIVGLADETPIEYPTLDRYDESFRLER